MKDFARNGLRLGSAILNSSQVRNRVHFALSELIRREKAKDILTLEGKIKWEGNLKQMRKARFASAD